MSPRPAATGPDISTPELFWQEATRVGRLADEAIASGDFVQARRHLGRANALAITAQRLKSDEAKEKA